MAKYLGACHCGSIKLCIDVEPSHTIQCNCSICTKKGIVHIPVPDAQFELLAGKDDLVLYQFKSNAASHWFCKRCGIHAFGRPRFAPTRYTVNARCLDEFAVFNALPVKQFNGQAHPLDD